MKMRIHKGVLETGLRDEDTGIEVYPVRMSKDHRILNVGEQNGVPTIWYEESEEGPFVSQEFTILDTGFDVPDGWVHRGTFFYGRLVWHVYEKEG